MRKAVPYLVLPLALIACCLASSPWLRSFPASTLAVPLFGTALLSVLLPVFVIGVGVRKLWLTGLIDIVGFAFFTMLVALHEPWGPHDLVYGLVHGPADVLSFALPLVSPRTLLVAPVALCWLCGAVVGECIGRGWHSVLPYATLLATFGLSYAGSARGITNTSDGLRYDTILAAALLLAILLLRAAQAWVEQDQAAETTQPEGVLPLRGLLIGTIVSVVVALLAAAVVQSAAFSGTPRTPQRHPPLNEGQPLTPLSFVSGLRPSTPGARGTPLFQLDTNRRTSNYVGIASVDLYDGDGWSFQRTFRPSGGVVPVDTDPQMRPHSAVVTQDYVIDRGPMTSQPWLPSIYRAQRVLGTSIDIDAASGMIVPSERLHAGQHYTVRSSAPTRTFADLPAGTLLATSAPQTETDVPDSLHTALNVVVSKLETETHVSSVQPVQFLQAVIDDFRDRYRLSGGPAPTTPTPSAPSGSASPASSGSPAPASSLPPAAAPSARTGGTSFADVLASILGDNNGRAGTPEQYATLVALIARELNVPARVVTGFRIPPHGAGIPAGAYTVTTGEAWTWVEVPIRGQGWVVLDPSPGSYSTSTPQQSFSTRPSPSVSQTATNQPLVTATPSRQNAKAHNSPVPHHDSLSTFALVLLILGGFVLLAVLGLLVPLAGKWARARRRRRPRDPRERLVGAWQESLDVLVESGMPPLDNLTSAEIAALTAEQFGSEPGAQAKSIGDSANVALFDPASSVEPAQADAAWRAQATLRKAVRSRLPLRTRVNAGLRYHRTRRTRPLEGPASWAAASRTRTTAAARSRRRRGH